MSRTGQVLAVRAMTFINPSDGIAVLGSYDQHGPLLMTFNGARTWHKVSLGGPGGVLAVAGHGDAAYALVLTCGASEACHGPRLYRAAAGSPR